MATQEQLQQFGNTSSGSSSDESEESTEELLPQEPKQPKLKLKFKLRLPKQEKNQPPPNPKAVASMKGEEMADVEEVDTVIVKTEEVAGEDDEVEPVVVSAMVVDDDEVMDDTTVVAEPVLSSSTATSRNTHTKKRQSVRPIKMPAIASPGLLLANGTTTAALFDHHMTMAGYSLEIRMENPHRGSSTKREVGDMFDTSVQFYKNFPKLVPPELIADSTDGDPKLIQFLKKGLKDPSSDKKRKRRFDEMLPLSLKIDYPSEYVHKRQEYLEQVKKREAAIVEAQEAELEERSPIEVPPIPDPPSPPTLEENQQGLDINNKHPFYPPKNDAFVKHLDQNCFHASEGRYVGLSSNSISDPHFIGAHAVGVQNLSVTAGTGLATTQTGSTSAGSASLASTVYGDRSKSDTKINSIEDKDKENEKQDKDESEPKPKAVNKKKKSASPAPPSTQSGSAGELKRIMEADTVETDAMRHCIIRAGVYASRAGRHGQSFLGPDGNTYQDVSKTFASYAGVKPCSRCKNNKQGAYHCRLRRKHKEMDYDGGNSPAVLAPLFDEALESLILKKVQ